MGGARIEEMLAMGIVLFFGIGLHEYAHCKMADLAGDPTPRYYGRVTLNLTKHFELFGTIAMIISTFVGFGLGWGKPAPMDPRQMKNPRWDHFAAVAAGPLSNILQAIVWAAILRLVLPATGATADSFPALLCLYGVLINLGLAVFNLLPIGPLDGSWLVGLALPERIGHRWFAFQRNIGFIHIFVGLTLLSQLGISLTQGPVLRLARLILGT